MPQQISVQDFIRQEAKSAGVPEALALSVADQESAFNPTVVNPKAVNGEHATGTFQLLPSTATTLGVDAADPVQNIRGGVKYLRQLLDKHQGDLQGVLQEYGGVRTDHTYVPAVLGKLQQYATPAGAAGPTPPVATPPPGLPPDRRANPQARPPSAEDFMTRTQRAERAVGNVAAEVGSQVDPRTPTGRRNIAGGIGAGLGTVAAAGTGGLAAPLVPILGAATGGLYEELGEQVAGTKAPSTQAALGAAGQQGAYEAAGQVIPWGTKLVGRRVMGYVAKSKGTQALAERLATLPEPAAAGRAADAVIRGPAQEARDLAGQAVDAAAKSGPMVDLRPLKKEAQAVVDRIAQPETSFPRVADPRVAQLEAATGKTVDQMRGDPRYASVLEAAGVGGSSSPLAAAQAEADRETLKHPAMKVLNRILNADDQVPFHDAHLWKSELQNSLASTYDQAQKKQVTSLTQHVAAGLRSSLAGHEPYNQATAHYAEIVPLYTKEYAARFRRMAATDPEGLVRIMSAKKPTATRMLRDLLVGQSAAGGQAAEGQAAWDSVRGAWTRTHLFNKGFEGLDAQLGSLPKEFRDVFFGDANGTMVEANLRQIAAASKVAKQALTPEQLGAHAARAGKLGPANLWGALSTMKLVMTGPQEKDLLEWAAYSPQNTQHLVDLMTGRSVAGPVLADIARATGAVPDKAGTPPPRMDRSRVGQPPPAMR